jgi:signal transduction histidine kinase
MKPKFAYIYVSFIVSLAILLVLSILFNDRFYNLRKYSENVDQNYNVIYQLQRLQANAKELETATWGFMLTADSSFLLNFDSQKSSLLEATAEVKRYFSNDDEEHFGSAKALDSLMKLRIEVMESNIHRVAARDTAGLKASVKEGSRLVHAFNKEAGVLESGKLASSAHDVKQKKFYENLAPGFFRTILLFAGAITIISFFFILREMRIRLRYQNELEKRVNELDQSNAELEQITFVASHDLQEPLRKIRTLSDRLIIKHGPGLTEEGRSVLDRLDVAARRMQELIQDMVNFTTLISTNETPVTTDLNQIVDKVVTEMKAKHNTSNPMISRNQLPSIKGYPSQLALLFREIIGNSVKFAKKGVVPVVNISYEMVDTKSFELKEKTSARMLHRIAVEDNGIGFDNELAKKIFIIFQRLHSQESAYRGKGIGLAIARRVMVNHEGFIVAKSSPGNGASFIMYFPVQ